jgi:hypothetical protein
MSFFAGSFPADKETGALAQQQGVPGVPPPLLPLIITSLRRVVLVKKSHRW